MTANPAQTADLADTDLGGVLADLAGFEWIPGISKLREALTEMAEAVLAGRLDTDASQTLTACLAGSNGADALTAIGHLAALTTSPDTNPALTHIDPDQAKEARLHGELLVHHLADDDLHQHASEAAAAIDQQGRRS
jgi:hypothetical protein